MVNSMQGETHLFRGYLTVSELALKGCCTQIKSIIYSNISEMDTKMGFVVWFYLPPKSTEGMLAEMKNNKKNKPETVSLLLWYTVSCFHMGLFVWYKVAVCFTCDRHRVEGNRGDPDMGEAKLSWDETSPDESAK